MNWRYKKFYKYYNWIWIISYCVAMYFNYKDNKNNLGTLLAGIFTWAISMAIFYIISRIFLFIMFIFIETIVDIKNKIVKKPKIERNIIYYNDVDSFDEARTSKKKYTKKNLNEIHVLKGNRQGAFIIINHTILNQNITRIKNGLVSRDNEYRANTNVLGFNKINNTPTFREDKQVNVFSYHRTHLLPFRMCLSDGDIENIMFTGTSHLNMGDRPKFNYYVDGRYKTSFETNFWDYEIYEEHGGSFKNRKYMMKEHLNHRDTLLFDDNGNNPSAFDMKKIYYKYNTKGRRYNKYTEEAYKRDLEREKTVLLEAMDFERSCHISLNDIEIAVTDYIKESDPSHIFRYGVTCNYDKDNHIIPDSVTVYFLNETKNIEIMRIKLDNIH